MMVFDRRQDWKELDFRQATWRLLVPPTSYCPPPPAMPAFESNLRNSPNF